MKRRKKWRLNLVIGFHHISITFFFVISSIVSFYVYTHFICLYAFGRFNSNPFNFVRNTSVYYTCIVPGFISFGVNLKISEILGKLFGIKMSRKHWRKVYFQNCPSYPWKSIGFIFKVNVSQQLLLFTVIRCWLYIRKNCGFR